MANTDLTSTFKRVANIGLIAAMSIFALTFPFSVKVSVLGTWLFLLAAVIYGVAYRNFRFRIFYLFPVLLFAIRLIGLLLADGIKFSFLEPSLSFLLLPLIFSFISLKKKVADSLLLFLFYGSMAVCLILIGSFVMKVGFQDGVFLQAIKSPKTFSQQAIGSLFYWHATYIAVLLSFTIPLAFYLCYTAQAIRTWLMLVGIAVALFAVYITGARTGAVVNLGILLFSFIFYFRKFAWATKVSSLVLALGVVLLALFNTSHHTSDPLRTVYLRLGCQAVKEHPITGSGLMSPKKYIQKYDEQNASNFAVHDYFHNQFIDEWAQFGIVGLLLLLAFWLYCARVAFVQRDYLLACFIIIFVPFMMFDSPLGAQSFKGIISFTFWFCLLATKASDASKDRALE